MMKKSSLTITINEKSTRKSSKECKGNKEDNIKIRRLNTMSTDRITGRRSTLIKVWSSKAHLIKWKAIHIQVLN